MKRRGNTRIAVMVLLIITLLAAPVAAETAVDAGNDAAIIVLEIGKTQAVLGDQIITLDTAPLIDAGGRTLVPLRFITEALGYEVQWESTGSRITILEEATMAIQMIIGSPHAVIRGEAVTLDSAPVIHAGSGRTLVPLRFVSENLGYDVEWESKTRTITIADPTGRLPHTSAAENGGDSELELDAYTLPELQQKALNYSRDLRRLGKEVDRNEIMRYEAALRKTFTPVGGGTTFEEFAASQAILGLLSADAQLAISEKRIETEEERVQHRVLSAWHDIRQNQRNVRLAQNNLSLAEQELKLSELRQAQGVISRVQLVQAQDALAEAQNAFAKAELDEQIAFEDMNVLTGLALSERYRLGEIIAPDEAETEIPELNRTINRSIANSPDIWALEKQVELAELALRLYIYNQEQAPYSAREIDVDTAKLSLSSAKQQTENLVRNLYNALEQIRNEKKDIDLSLKQAQDNLEITQVRVSIGMAIPMDVLQAKKLVLQLENAVESLNAQFEIMLETYQKPWLAAANTGQ